MVYCAALEMRYTEGYREFESHLLRMFKWILLAATALLPYTVLAVAGPFSLTVYPESIMQGEPAVVTIVGITSTSSVKKISFDGVPLGLFLNQNKVTALIGIDLNKKPGSYILSVEMSGGTKIENTVTVVKRERIQEPFSIPTKLGGNTVQSQKTLVSTLAAENASLAHITTGKKAFWKDTFVWPLESITVTDSYGYSRETGAYSIAHKGTDFRAAEGTKVLAINRGVVRIAKTYRNYGKTVVVDHGLGLMSFYMHLSKIKVATGQLVVPGQVVGSSGQTGYAEQPHLHLTIRINGTSIDPMKFFERINTKR